MTAVPSAFDGFHTAIAGLGGFIGQLRKAPQRAGQLAGIAVGAMGLTRDRPITGPLYAQLSIADPCDHRCVMCEYHPPSEERAPLEQFGGMRPGLIDLDTYRRTVDELHALGTRQVDLVGRGEPLLNPHVPAMVEYAKSRGFAVTMISNGSRLTPEMAESLTRLGLDRFRLSLNAGRPETYPKIHVTEKPEDWLRVKARIAHLCSIRDQLGKTTPHVTLAFVIGAPNYLDLVEMVDVVHETGANAAHFQHAQVVTTDGEGMRLSDAQFADLQNRLLPAAEARASSLGVESDLRTFAATPPSYLITNDAEHPAVVPCYIGSFFTVILGNGNVMPCCQTQLPIASLDDQTFTDIWQGDKYRDFRRAARALPTPDPALDTCECDRCYFRSHNVTIHNTLHPFSRIPVDKPGELLSVDQLVRMSRLDKRR